MISAAQARHFLGARLRRRAARCFSPAFGKISRGAVVFECVEDRGMFESLLKHALQRWIGLGEQSADLVSGRSIQPARTSSKSQSIDSLAVCL